MSYRDSVTVKVQVPQGPDEAFRIFTEEIDHWYRKDRNTLFDVDRTKRLAFEPFPGGRLLEIYSEETLDGRELGRITRWEPGRLLVFRDHHGTTVSVTFVARGDGTCVTLTHSGFSLVPESDRETVRRFGWTITLPWFAAATGVVID
jgi:uncharacterized protein YndB with AHSA1/START domain